MLVRLSTSFLIGSLLQGCLATDAFVDRYLDADRDGERTHAVGGTDCDDADASVGVGQEEVCGNGRDDDCDGVIDDRGVGEAVFYADGDGDGFGAAAHQLILCDQPAGYAAVDGDCDDANSAAHPGAVEDCTDGFDNDCDGEVDNVAQPPLWWPDNDGDGRGDRMGPMVASCRPGDNLVDNNDDCDDENPGAYLGAPEVPYDGVDQDCAGGDDFDLDGDGYRLDPTSTTDAVSEDYTPDPGWELDCNDRDPFVHPHAAETHYDGVDQDCDGADDFDADGDGWASSLHGGEDCDDADREVFPGAEDRPRDGVDSNCDGSDDYDADGDGHRAPSVGGDDCDDDNPRVWLNCATCVDEDEDGVWVGCDDPTRVEDCDDANELAWESCATCRDADQDGRFTGCDRYPPDTAEDCDDARAEVWTAAACVSCRDEDQDGAWVGCDAYPIGFLEDCDDERVNAWASCATCPDADGDGVGAGQCDGSNLDCDDTLAAAWTTCLTCADLDGDGVPAGDCDIAALDIDDGDPNTTTGGGACVDADLDGAFVDCDQYVSVARDCDDSDPESVVAEWEVPGDGIDQDCDGSDLPVADGFGVFVSLNGEDDGVCGAMADPCRSIGVGEARAHASGAHLFVAAGTYEEEVSLRVGLSGSLDPVTWAPSEQRTEVVGTVDVLPELGRDLVRVAGLDVVPSSVRGGTVAVVHVLAPRVLLADMHVQPPPLGSLCTAVKADFGTLRIEDSWMGSCQTGPVHQTVVAGVVPRPTHRFEFVRSDVAVEASHDGECTGIQFVGHELALIASEVRMAGCRTTYGLDAYGPTSSTRYPWMALTEVDVLMDQTVVVATGQELAAGADLTNAAHANVRRTLVEVTSEGQARGVRLNVNYLGAIDYMRGGLLDTVGLVVAGSESSVGLSSDGRPHVNVVHSSLHVRSERGEAVGIELMFSSSTSVLNSIINSSGSVLWGRRPDTLIELRGLLVDSSCTSLLDGFECVGESVEAFRECAWPGCVGVSDLEVDAARMGRDLRLLAGSPAIGNALVPVEASQFDLFGAMRPTEGPWDLGAVQYRPLSP